jgi:hypothetical protein
MHNGTVPTPENDEQSYTFSMHEKENYPVKQQSNHDVELASYISDDEYLRLLRENLDIVADRCLPDLIFYIAGVDVYKDDALGGLELTFDGIAERDRLVKNFMPDVPRWLACQVWIQNTLQAERLRRRRWQVRPARSPSQVNFPSSTFASFRVFCFG